MLEMKVFRESPQLIFEDLEKRNMPIEIAKTVIDLDNRWRKLIDKGNNLRAKRNSISKEISDAKKKGDDFSNILSQMSDLKKELLENEKETEETLKLRDSRRMVVPNILESVHLDSDDFNIGSETRHMFAAAGYVFDINNDFKFKPHAFMKYASEAPISLDLNANLFMYDFVEVGLGYRTDDSITAMVNFLVSPSIRIGYAYDSIQSELSFLTKASHEIFINFDINFRTKVSRSPRYF